MGKKILFLPLRLFCFKGPELFNNIWEIKWHTVHIYVLTHIHPQHELNMWIGGV